MVIFDATEQYDIPTQRSFTMIALANSSNPTVNPAAIDNYTRKARRLRLDAFRRVLRTMTPHL